MLKSILGSLEETYGLRPPVLRALTMLTVTTLTLTDSPLPVFKATELWHRVEYRVPLLLATS